jgi:hypothetical protein
MNVADWLRGLGVERYEPAFRENRISNDLPPRLIAEDLKDLGVTPVGDRRRLLDAGTWQMPSLSRGCAEAESNRPGAPSLKRRAARRRAKSRQAP